MSNNSITIYTDATVDLKKGVGFWAFHAKSSLGSYQLRGTANRTIWDNNVAEQYAICVAIWRCHQKWPSLKAFLVKTDSKFCTKVWCGVQKNLNSLDKRGIWEETIQMMEDLRATLKDCTVYVKWVKSHQDSETSTTYLNNKVDKMVKVLRDGDDE